MICQCELEYVGQTVDTSRDLSEVLDSHLTTAAQVTIPVHWSALCAVLHLSTSAVASDLQ